MSISDQYNSSIELQLRSLEVPPQLPPLFNSIMHCVTLTHHDWLAYMSLLLFIHSSNNVRGITLFTTTNHVIWIFILKKKKNCYMDIYSIKKNVIWILVYYKFYYICYINYFSLIIKIIQLLIYYFIVMLLIIFIVISICKSFVIKFVAVLAFFLTIYIFIN